ncbi:MAG: UPF0182 family protein [Microcella sp.]|uniref:UPF0182 family membrane protein n=1 Tax=Microcella sp. TaxID=1913979 RepID=UPI0024C8C4DD|nr:UPF0182 family protein [Microcella sp.]UYN84820.1 MAG: UPF0182 family protein [Microcella sp.]
MTSTAAPPANRSRSTLAISAVVLGVIVVLFFVFANVYTDILWFDQLGYLNVLTTQWIATGAMFVVGFLGMFLPVWASLQIAYRWRPVYAKLNSQLDRYQEVVEPLRRVAMLGIPAVLGLFAGVTAAGQWQMVLQWLNRTPFGTTDAQFGFDISFFVYELPFIRGIIGFASGVVLISILAAVATSYLYGAIRVNGREIRISRTARIQLAIMAAIYIALQGVSIWFDQYATVVQPSDGFLAIGAGFTEVNATIPSRGILAGIAIFVALLFIITAIIGRWRLPIVGTALLLVSGLLIGSVYPWIVQRFQVEPSARTIEAPFIQRNIDATRDAFGVADLQEISYSAVVDAEAGALREDAETTANIRIIDPALVTTAFAQLEQFRQYYQFPRFLDVDRYEIDGQIQDTVLSLRELNPAGQTSQNWYNNTIVFTHGYGVVAAYGNQRTDDGRPLFLEGGIPAGGSLTDELGEYEPRVYFGESSPVYSIVGGPEGGPELELDFPSEGSSEQAGNATYTFTGDGGPTLDNVFKRLLYAIKFQSEQIFLSEAVTDDSQILYERNPLDRVQKAAPYLKLDSDPYPAIVDGRIVWIVDGYTTTASYPYSTSISLSQAIADTYTPPPAFALDQINYIRNSVKATVDAYDGSVTLYAWDTEDPILQTWQKVFPTTIVSADEMSDDLLSHVRYPADLFKAQRSILGAYHVTEPGSFFSTDDEWRTPNDPISSAANPTLQPPYYLTMQVPGTSSPGFTLYSTFIPRTASDNERNVLTGYLAANADPGPDYGKLTLLTLPSQTIPGPGQVQNQFNSDTEVANQLALLQRGETEVLRGNLLTLPVGGGFLYVQPIYVQSTGETSFPLLRKILVAFGDEIAFEDTLDQALDALFGGDSGANAGDGDVEPVDPTDPTAPTDPSEPGVEISAALAQALRDARDALLEREAAYARNDLVGAAQADERLQEALERAIALSD